MILSEFIKRIMKALQTSMPKCASSCACSDAWPRATLSYLTTLNKTS